jgi:hypothetical protein
MTPRPDSSPGPGDFAVVQINNAAGRLIRLGQWLNGGGFADYEHAFIFLGRNNCIVEAEPGGAKLSPLSNYPENRLRWHHVDDPITGQRIADEALKLIGTPYSFADYLALAAVRLRLPLSARLLRRYVASSGHMICSQLVDYAYLQAGVHLFNDGRLPGDVTPADLAKLCNTI